MKAEQARKKEDKAQRHQQRKITLAQTTSSAAINARLAVVASGPSFTISDGGLLSAISGD